jgi:hypothetical protein
VPYGGKRGGGIAKKPKMEHDEEKWMMNVWERRVVMIVMEDQALKVLSPSP